MIFFTADTHFGDRRVLNIDRRPFGDMTAHDTALIDNWNSVIGPDDEVWHLGDFMSSRGGDSEGLLARLKGRKHLVVGNNDPEKVTGAAGWESIHHYAELTIEEHFLVLCHYPFRTWNKIGRKSINLHGHSRTAGSSRCHVSMTSGSMLESFGLSACPKFYRLNVFRSVHADYLNADEQIAAQEG